uniref:Peptidase S1 domain-containing protein n=1 Tax=Trichuris muris TaxID=70415 RepID=A0A5S6QI46_TRIMR
MKNKLLVSCFLLTLVLRLNAKRGRREKSFPCGVSEFPQSLRPRRQNRVLNGWETRPNAFPWIVAVFYKPNMEFKVACGGSLIDLQKKNYSSTVLTATHCFLTGKRYDKATDYYVVGGLHDIKEQNNEAVQRSNVAKYLRLDFDNSVLQNDISVVILEQPLLFTQYVRPICLPKPCGTFVPGSDCVTAGWGLVDGIPATTLQMMDVKISNPNKCKKDYGDNFNHHQQICVNIPRSKRNVCRGDSGGPLFCKENAVYVLYGLVSYGSSCDEMDAASVYTRVPAFLHWIDQMGGIYNPKNVTEFQFKKSEAEAAIINTMDPKCNKYNSKQRFFPR